LFGFSNHIIAQKTTKLSLHNTHKSVQEITRDKSPERYYR